MAQMKWRMRVVPAAVGIVTVGAVWHMTLSPAARNVRLTARLERKLLSEEPQARKEAAWATIERPDPALAAIMIRGVLGDEPDPDVREAYVYSLGKLSDPRHLAAIESAIDQDPSGCVRSAAWLAAARCDPQHFRTLAATRRQPERPWDQIGVAQGRLCLGDVRDVAKLLHWARAGDGSQRQVASRALFKWLRPLLDTAGRWPADCGVQVGQAWPPELVDEVERRCAGLNLQAVADDNSRHRESGDQVRRNVGRITRFRDGLAELLVGG